MTNFIQKFYKQNHVTFFTFNDYSSIKTQVVPSIAYAATLICLSCIFSSSLPPKGRISFLVNKAGLLLQESAKLGTINYLVLTLGKAIFVQMKKDGFMKDHTALLPVCTNIFITRLITNLALYSISFLLIGKTSTLKLSSSLTRYSFLVLTHMLSCSFYIKKDFYSSQFLADYMSIQRLDDLSKLFNLAIELRNVSYMKAVMKHEKFDCNILKNFKEKLIEVYNERIFSEKDIKEMNDIIEKKEEGNGIA